MRLAQSCGTGALHRHRSIAQYLCDPVAGSGNAGPYLFVERARQGIAQWQPETDRIGAVVRASGRIVDGRSRIAVSPNQDSGKTGIGTAGIGFNLEIEICQTSCSFSSMEVSLSGINIDIFWKYPAYPPGNETVSY